MMKNRLTRKLLFYIVLCSASFTLLATAFQLYMEYREDLAAVHESIEFIESSYLKSITTSAYDMDEKQLRLQLQGALKLQDIEYLEIIETRTAGEVIIAAQGNPNSRKDIVREFSLEYTDAPEGAFQTATLRVTVSLEGVYQRLWAHALIVLASNAGKALVASFFIFLIIQFLITRHIIQMAEYTRQLDPDKLDRELVLDRRTHKSSRPDELDQLVTAFNNIRVRLFENIEERRRAEERVKRLNSILMAIRNVNQMIVVEKDRDSLLQKACNILIEARGYDAAWLGFSLDDKTFATVKGAGFREDISRFSEHVIGGGHPSCIRRIIAEKQKLLIVDKPGECEDCLFKEAHTSNATIIIRVEHADRFYGLLAILFAPDVTADEEEKELLKEVAGDMAIALRGMKLEEDSKRAEEKIKHSLREKETLLAEIHHRVKNNMQIITSLLSLQSKDIEDERALSLIKNCEDRIRSMALVHEKLYLSKDLSQIDFHDYMEDLSVRLFQVHRVDSRVVSFSSHIKDVSFNIETAIPLGLIANELISNVMKHAFPEGRKGKIAVKLS
ncbi:MAG: hypothetical protein JRD43_08130, partial [Deltaproteobacteria bacterium]|nr:hypothetical protein [Deltaproteobacteria bacterium]